MIDSHSHRATDICAFYLWTPMRDHWVAEHKFLLDQARTRVLSQFDRIDEEADEAAEAFVKRSDAYFDPERDDPGDVYDEANNVALGFATALSQLREEMKLQVIASLYQQWEKTLRAWMIEEVRRWAPSAHVLQAMQQNEVEKLFDLLRAFGFDPRALPDYCHLDAMHLLVNVHKHGPGKSLDKLSRSYPEFLSARTADYQSAAPPGPASATLLVHEDAIDAFSRAIVGFWNALPERLWITDAEIHAPAWFENAVAKDRDA